MVEAQLFHRTTKVVEARQREAADFIVAALTEVDLVHIQLKNAIFAVAGIHQHRHVRFVGLTPVGAFAGEEQVFYQLLGQGTCPLHRPSGSQVRQHRTANGVQADTIMFIEVTVFGRQQGIHQQIRETVTRDKQTLLAVWRGEHGDQSRIETEETELTVVVHVLDGVDMIAIESQTRTHLPLFAVREVKRTADHLDAFRLHRKLAGTRHLRHLAVLGGLQQLDHLVLADGHFRLEVDHPAIHRRWQLPDFTVDTATDLLIQIDAVDRQQDDENNK